ncbi:hypothetical protein [Methanobrevibacter arboriphilus]|uniref:hypothetical protein n=1 Tax=Methanobrevibacter arboriphilus TaxID=39441 RepID=UPI0005B29084|nr:hypothetical protein [Methanobrevibacter arboriphilus]
MQERGFIRIKPIALTKHIKLTKEGRISFFKYENTYNNYAKEIVSAMINEGLDSNDDIIIQKELPISFVEAILEDFNDKNYINLSDGCLIGKSYTQKDFTITGIGRRYFKKLLK